MTVAIDATVLVFLFDATVAAPLDPATGQPVPDGKARIEHLVAQLEKSGERLVVPTPALAEVLVRAGPAAPEWLAILARSSVFRIADFDMLAAVEFAELNRQSLANRPPGDSKRKIKFDDQIVAIAKVAQATRIYSDDGGIKRHASPSFEVIGIADLPLPPSAAQHVLPLSPPEPPDQ